MPGTGRVESVINTPLTGAELQETIKGLKEVDELIRKMPQVMSLYKGATGASEFKAASAEMEAGSRKVVAAQTDLDTIIQRVTNRMVNLNGQTVEFTKAVKLEAEATLKLAQAKAIEDKLRKSAEDSIKKETAATQKLTQEQKLQQTVNNAAAGSYNQLDAQLRLLMIQYRNLSEAERNSATGKQLQQDILEKNAQLKIFDADLGNYQRNVGNYNSSLGRLSKGIKGLGGLGVILSRALGIDPEISQSIREAGRAIRDIQHARELEEVGLKGEAALYEQSKHKLDSFAAAAEGATSAEVGLGAATNVSTSSIAKNTVVENVNTVSTEAAAVAQEELAVATTSSSAAMSTFGKILLYSGIAVAALAIGYVIYKIIEYKNEITETIRKQKEMDEAIKNSSKEFEEAVTLVNKLKEEIKLAKEGFLDKTEVLNEYNNTIGKTIGKAKDLDEAEKDLTKNADAYVKMTLYKAAANYALEEASKKAFEAEQNRRKKDQEFQSIGTNASVFSSGQSSAPGFVPGLNDVNAGVKARVNAAKREKEEKVKIAEDEKNSLLDIANKFQSDAAKIAKENHFDFFGGEKNSKDKKEKKTKAEFDPTAEEIKAAQDLIKIKQEMRKYDLEGQMKYLQTIVDDEKQSMIVRVRSAEEYSQVQEQLARELEKSEVDVINVKLKKIDEIELKSASKRTNEEKKLLIDKQVLLLQKEQAEKKYADAVDAIHIDLAKKLSSLDESFIKKIEGGFATEKSKEILKNTQDETAAYDALNKKLKEGTITLQNYEKERQKIADDTNLKNDEADEKEIQRRIDLYKLFGKDTTALEIDLLKIHTKIEKDKTKSTEDEAKKRYEIEKELADKKKEIANKAYDLGVAVVDGVYTKQLNNIQDQIDASTKLKDAEIERINTSTLTEEQKAARLAMVNSAAQARQDQLEQKKKETQLKQAKFDRDAQALSIFGNALAAHFKLIATLGPAGIPIAIANDIAAALDIALLFAKPLPKFFTGTESSPEGWALTDEKGPEMYRTPSGEVFMGNDKPTLRYLERGTQIIPHDEVNRIMMKSMIESTSRMFGLGNSTDKKIDELKEVIMWQTNQLSKAYGKQKHKTVNNIRVDTKWGEYIQKQVFD